MTEPIRAEIASPSAAGSTGESGLIPPVVDGKPPVGSDVPRSVYRLILGFYAWTILAAWIAYGRTTEAEWTLTVAVIIATMLFGIPAVIRHVSFHHQREKRRTLAEFVQSEVDVAGGRLSGGEALLQILLIPCALAVLATAIAIVFLEVGVAVPPAGPT